MELRTLYVRKDYSTEYVYEMPEEQRHRPLWSSYSPEKEKEDNRRFRKERRKRQEQWAKVRRQENRHKSMGLNAGMFYVSVSWEGDYFDDFSWASQDVPLSRSEVKSIFDPSTGEWYVIESGIEHLPERKEESFWEKTGELALKIHAYDDKKRIDGLLRRLSVLSITGGPCPEIAETMAKLKEIRWDDIVDAPYEDTVMALHALIAPLLEAERRLAATVSRVTSRTSRVQILTVRPSRGVSRQRAPRSHRVAVSVRGGDSGDDDSGESDPPAPPLSRYGCPYLSVTCNPQPITIVSVDLISRVPMADGHFAWTFGGV